MHWRVTLSTCIVFGPGTVEQVAAHTPGNRVVLVTSPGFSRRGVVGRIADSFGSRLVEVVDTITSNPEIAMLDAMAVSLRASRPDALIGLGGGSAMDAAKVLAIGLNAPSGWTLAQFFAGEATFGGWPGLPVTAIPTTAGTGAEVTPFATVWDKKAQRKHSLAGPEMMPSLALLDPELTLGLPEAVTVATGLDAVSQALEALWNCNANPVTDSWALRSLRLSMSALPQLLSLPGDLALRSHMLEASLLAGLAISHTRTALAHSMSYPITARFGLPHGLACGFTVPAIFRHNVTYATARMDWIARELGFAAPDALETTLLNLMRIVGVRERVLRHVPNFSQLYSLTKYMLTPSRSNNTLFPVTEKSITAILQDTEHLFFRETNSLGDCFKP